MKTDRPELKKNNNMWVALWPLLFLVLALGSQAGQSPLTKTMGITQHLGQVVPKDTPFTDEYGKQIHLGDELRGKPVVLVPVFYSCKTGCAILTDNIIKTLAKATKGDILKPGRDFDVLMYSIDPVENADLAHAKKALIMNALVPPLPTPGEVAAWRKSAEQGWHLLTGSKESISKLSEAIGFKFGYRTVPDIQKGKTLNLINHATCTVMLTPEGAISSYTIGNNFQTKEVESNLALAQSNRIGISADQSYMFGCLMVDPTTGRNRLVIEQVWRLIGVATVLVLFGSILSMFLKGNREKLSGGGGLSTR